MKERILRLRSEKYKHLVDILLLISFGQIGLVLFGVNFIFQERNFLFDLLIRMSTMLMFFLQGCAGFVMMIRREFRQGVIIRGRTAQVMGFIFWMIGWFLALYVLAYSLTVSHLIFAQKQGLMSNF